MSESEPRWSFHDSSTSYSQSKWLIRRDNIIVGSVVLSGKEFRAFLKTSEYEDGDYLGTFANMPLAIEGIKEMLAMK